MNENNDEFIITYSGTSTSNSSDTITYDSTTNNIYLDNINPDIKYNYNIVINDYFDRIKEFYSWINKEQNDLSEECGMDLSGIIDRLEETFPELCDIEIKKCQIKEAISDTVNANSIR